MRGKQIIISTLNNNHSQKTTMNPRLLYKHYMGQNFERCTIGNFQTLSTSITPGSPPVTQKPFLLVSS